MYACVCNAISDRKVRSLAREGKAATYEEVFAALGATPCCGRCEPTIWALLEDEARKAPAPLMPPCLAALAS